MFKNYFKTAWRNMLNNKVYSALNIVGLATGMAVALLIGLWVFYQLTFDHFLPGYQQANKVMMRVNINGEVNVGGATPLPLGEAIKKDIPGIKYVAQTDWMGAHGLVAGDKKLYPGGATVGKDFLKIFQYPLLKGNAEDVLKEPNSIVLSQSSAKALFGSDDVINKIVRIDNNRDLKVTGILKDLPANSTFQFNFLVPLIIDAQNEDARNWRNNSYQTFIALEPTVSTEKVDLLLSTLLKKYDNEDYKTSHGALFLHPVKDWNLYSDFRNGASGNGFISYVKMFSIIGILVLLIACINFINLSTARSEKRAKEVGIRKAIGSQRKELIFQFLIESLAIVCIAFLLCLLMVQLALPWFDKLTQAAIHIPYGNFYFWMIMISYVLVTGLIAGSRPAFYLSSFQPIKVLKGAVKTGGAATLPRKVLVVLQFSCSIALIISTVIIYQQIQYAKNRPTGYNASRLVMTDASEDLTRNYSALKNDLLQTGAVTNVTRSSSPATDIWSSQRIDDWQGKLPGEALGLSTVGTCDADFFKTLGMQLVQGRSFTGNGNSDSLNVILNEAAVKRMRYKDPINQTITWHDVPQKVTVIGVVKDALITSPFAPADPTIFIYTPSWSNIITYRLAANISTQSALDKLASVFNKYNPSFPYLYKFVDDAYAAKFNLETLIGRLAGLFAALAIFISCLGLFGLAAYMAEQRTKEIGIRKVSGASVAQLWLMLSKDFIILVLISCFIASPAALYFLTNWLEHYTYRISVGPWVFIAAALAAIAVTLATVSVQAIKAAIANPVKSLRSE